MNSLSQLPRATMLSDSFAAAGTVDSESNINVDCLPTLIRPAKVREAMAAAGQSSTVDSEGSGAQSNCTGAQKAQY